MRNVLRATAALIPVLALGVPVALVQNVAANPAVVLTPDTFLDVATPDCLPAHVAGSCSLRGAVLMANGSPATTVQLGAGTYMLTKPQGSTADDGEGGDLEILTAMTIKGAGAGQTKIQGGPNLGDRVIEADSDRSAVVATISDLTVTGGVSSNTNTNELAGGGIFNDGSTLTLTNVIVDSNRTGTGDVGNVGGGVASIRGTISISNTTFTNNTADNNGGGLYNLGTVASGATFSHLYFTGNTANGEERLDSGGGAIYNAMNSGTTATFTDIMAIANHAPNMSGGAVYEESSPFMTTITYNRMTLSGNTALVQGGGFYAGTTNTTISDSTITGNTQHASVEHPGVADGGGVAVGDTGTVHLNNDTIANNKADGSGGGLYDAFPDVITIHNTLVVNNDGGGGTVANCRYLNPSGPNNGVLTSQGHNIANDTSCNLTASGDRQGSGFDPNLGVLVDNGGPSDGAPGDTNQTLTRALPTGSIAINTADNTNCPAVDERGITRPQQATCDVGAYEYVAPVASPTPALPKAGSSPPAPSVPRPFALPFAVLALAGAPLLWRTLRAAPRRQGK